MKMPKPKARQLLPDDLDVYAGRLDKDSDRGAALIGAALLDAQLEDIFHRRLAAHKDWLLAINGPLGAFAVRIKLARALGWIDEDVQGDLDIVRDVRNRFAHSFDHDLTFTDKQIAGWCSSLRSLNALLTGFDQAKERLSRSFSLELIARWRAALEPPRSRYLTAVHFLAQHLKEAAELGGSERGLVEELTDLGRSFNVQIRATATVGGAARDVAADD